METAVLAFLAGYVGMDIFRALRRWHRGRS
jgi:hypothetical protein